jgi:hypothetical protein
MIAPALLLELAEEPAPQMMKGEEMLFACISRMSRGESASPWTELAGCVMNTWRRARPLRGCAS